MTDGDEEISLLLVDDRADKLLALEVLLSDLGARIVTASSGREALRCLLKQDFAAILLDVSMPEMDGFETAALIRQRKNTEHTPIIFITSINTSDTHVSKGYSLGAVDYIFTPIVPEVLRAKVSVFIDLTRKNRLIAHHAELLRKEAEKRADELENRLHNLLNRLDVGVFRASTDGELLEANPALLRLLQLETLEEARKSPTVRLLIDSALPLSAADSSSSAIDVKWPDNRSGVSWIALSAVPVMGGTGKQFVEGLIENISRRKEAEEALASLNCSLEERVAERSEELRKSQESLMHSERLASLGTLATGIAHEINNPLNAILGLSEYALQSPLKQSYDQTLALIAGEAQRCGKIIHGVLQFARNQKTIKTPHDLNSVVAHTLDLLKTYVPGSVVIDRDLSHGPLPVMVNTTEIEQVIVNIVKNAVDAADANVRILVTTEPRNTSAVLRIEDNGPGIPVEIRERIFDPFFSTRSTRGGTGLGLSVSHGIVTQHNGSISVQNSPLHGASFVIELPLESDDDGDKFKTWKQPGKINTPGGKAII